MKRTGMSAWGHPSDNFNYLSPSHPAWNTPLQRGSLFRPRHGSESIVTWQPLSMLSTSQHVPTIPLLSLVTFFRLVRTLLDIVGPNSASAKVEWLHKLRQRWTQPVVQKPKQCNIRPCSLTPCSSTGMQKCFSFYVAGMAFFSVPASSRLCHSKLWKDEPTITFVAGMNFFQFFISYPSDNILWCPFGQTHNVLLPMSWAHQYSSSTSLSLAMT